MFHLPRGRIELHNANAERKMRRQDARGMRGQAVGVLGLFLLLVLVLVVLSLIL